MLKRSSLVLLTATCLALAACGGGGSTASGDGDGAKQDLAERFRLASTKSLEANSVRFSMQMNTPDGVMSGEGEQDLAGRKVKINMTMPVPGMGTVTMEQIMSGTVMFMRGSMFEGLLPAGTWARFDLAAMGDELGVDLAALMDQAFEMDAQSAANFLRGVDGEVTEVGQETVRGVESTRYSYTVDLNKAMENLPPELAADVAPMFEALGTDKFPAEVWLDEEGLLRKMAYTMNVPVEGGSPAEIETDMEFYDYGAPVNITEPPAAQTVDIAEEIRKAG